MGGVERLGMPSLEAIPINQICKSDGFREELNPSYKPRAFRGVKKARKTWMPGPRA
jgi:hypothetical protein